METFKQKYIECNSWQCKVIWMNIFHSIMCSRFSDWKISETAKEFNVSIGLVSENLRLVDNPKAMRELTREDGLKLIERRHYTKSRISITLYKG